jgi:hypothetical protein
MVKKNIENNIDNITNKGSSETLREALNFDKKFLSWFIGFSEGDGCFCLSDKRGYLEFKITQASIDAQVLFYIKKQLGFGSVRVQDKKNETHHFRVRDKKNLMILISIFNGFLLTEKKNAQFQTWLKAFNERYKMNIEYIPNKNNFYLNLNNGWLSGFTDAEGCFTASVVKRTDLYSQVHVRYILSQKGEQQLLMNIASLVNGNLHFLKSYEGYNLVVTLSKLSLVIKYFKQYPLKTKKNISFYNWLKLYDYVIEKKHMTEAGLFIIKDLAKKINKEF